MAEGDGVSVAVGNDDETQPLLPVKAAKGDDIKSHMANERTFFKWLFIGTLQNISEHRKRRAFRNYAEYP